jgi:hypothetical protein
MHPAASSAIIGLDLQPIVRPHFLVAFAAYSGLTLLAASAAVAATSNKDPDLIPKLDNWHCEAMQKAKDSLSQSGAISLQIFKAQITVVPIQGEASSDKEGLSPIQAEFNTIIALQHGKGDPEAVDDMKRILEISSEMKKAGCPKYS